MRLSRGGTVRASCYLWHASSFVIHHTFNGKLSSEYRFMSLSVTPLSVIFYSQKSKDQYKEIGPSLPVSFSLWGRLTSDLYYLTPREGRVVVSSSKHWPCCSILGLRTKYVLQPELELTARSNINNILRIIIVQAELS